MSMRVFLPSETLQPCNQSTTCLETILAAFPGASVVSPEEIDLLRQQAEVDKWNEAQTKGETA